MKNRTHNLLGAACRIFMTSAMILILLPELACIWPGSLVKRTQASPALYMDLSSSGMPANPYRWQAVFTVAAKGDLRATELTPVMKARGGRIVSLQPDRAKLRPWGEVAFRAIIERDPSAGDPHLDISFKEIPTFRRSTPLPMALPLTDRPWEGWHQATREATAAPGTQAQWQSIKIPGSWPQAGGVQWLRCRFTVPSAWQGRPLHLRIPQVDDLDATFLNGVRIGTGSGWDQPRDYAVPLESVHWGEANELCIEVMNQYPPVAGIYRGPIVLLSGADQAIPSLLKDTGIEHESARAPQEPIGERLPLRRMTVQGGLLRYEEGGEVALWGVNYCPPNSMRDPQNLASIGVTDIHKAIEQDLDDLEWLGAEVMRIPLFEGNFTDAAGNPIEGDQLDAVDYMIDQCNRRGIYVMLTPISAITTARSPQGNGHSLCKKGMALWREGWAVQQHYLEKLFERRNPYSGRRLAEEPSLALIEIVNEPHCYYDFDSVQSGAITESVESQAARAAKQRAMAGIQRDWRDFASPDNWQTPETYAHFRYARVRGYVNAMTETMRRRGARQPILYHADGDPEVRKAIADSRCEGVTLWAYPGSLIQITDDQNMLDQLGDWPLDAIYRDKARVIYEFDAAGQVRRSYAFAALARQSRHRGAQVACQFQYDPRSTAAYNLEWPQHYLNLWHTPEKMADWLVGRELFHRLPRGASANRTPEGMLFPPGAASFQYNTSLLCAEDCYIQSRPGPWRPLPAPRTPAAIYAVGDTPYYRYSGTGLVCLRREHETTLALRLFPDVQRRPEGWTGTTEDPLTRLSEGEHRFRLTLAGWEDARAERKGAQGWEPVPANHGEFLARPGTYRLTRPAAANKK